MRTSLGFILHIRYRYPFEWYTKLLFPSFFQMGIMVGTFIGPGGIYMALAGGLSTVFEIDAFLSLALNIIPLFLYCLACYYTNSKFQLALAKILTVGYTMLMLAVYVGLAVQIIESWWAVATFREHVFCPKRSDSYT